MTIRRALIGHTGFVGSTLFAAGDFTDTFNSANFRKMAGGNFDEVVCCGIPSVKWLANKEPEGDWAKVAALLDVLETVRAGRFTLISTIDVYPNPAARLDESAVLTGQDNSAYGRHRLAVEAWVARRFPAHTIARLPALFGQGLKKNILFDLLTGNLVEKVNPASVFQWYPLRRLPRDLETARAHDLSLVNLFVEPQPTTEILNRFFPSAAIGPATLPAPSYDTRTRHATLFGGSDGYIASRREVMVEMDRFIAAWPATVMGTSRV
jgi:hypothetical protein